MTELEKSQTHRNLLTAFSREAAANRLYHYFARIADRESQPDAAAAFREAAEGETGHALGHLDFLREVGDPIAGQQMGDTRSNLELALRLEEEEREAVYPRMAATARSEGFDEIARWFESLARAEDSHAGQFTEILERLGDSTR